MTPPPGAPTPLGRLLVVTFFGSISGGAFWAAIFFLTAAHYHFSPQRNLLLGASMGLIYAVAAQSSGWLQRRLQGRLSPRAILTITFSVWGLAALLPMLVTDSEPLIWIAALVGAGAAACTWPVVESFMSAGRHGASMRQAIGRFNMTWTSATAVALLVLPVLARVDDMLMLVMSGAANAVALIALRGLPVRPPAHDAAAAVAAVGRDYVALKQAASWLLPMSYLMSSTLSPLLPHRLASLGTATAASAVAALWMIGRFATLTAMARVHVWHGRWGTLLAAAVALCGGLALVLLSQSLPGVMVGLFVFGVGMGLTYYAALYYSLAVGHAAVDAGGGFEALIGLGYFVGPLIGVGGQALGRGHAASARSYTVALTWMASTYFLARAGSVFLRLRRGRAGTGTRDPGGAP